MTLKKAFLAANPKDGQKMLDEAKERRTKAERIAEVEAECQRELDKISDILSEDIGMLRRDAEGWKSRERYMRDDKIKLIEGEAGE